MQAWHEPILPAVFGSSASFSKSLSCLFRSQHGRNLVATEDHKHGTGDAKETENPPWWKVGTGMLVGQTKEFMAPVTTCQMLPSQDLLMSQLLICSLSGLEKGDRAEAGGEKKVG